LLDREIRKDMDKNGWTSSRIVYNGNCDNDYMPKVKNRIGDKLYIDKETYDTILKDLNDNIKRETGKTYKNFKNLDIFDVYIIDNETKN